MCLSTWLYLYLPDCISIYLTVFLSMTVFLPVYLYVSTAYLPDCMSLCLSTWLYVSTAYLPDCMSLLSTWWISTISFRRFRSKMIPTTTLCSMCPCAGSECQEKVHGGHNAEGQTDGTRRGMEYSTSLVLPLSLQALSNGSQAVLFKRLSWGVCIKPRGLGRDITLQKVLFSFSLLTKV